MPQLRGPLGRYVSPSAVAAAGSPYISLDTNARFVAARLELASALIGASTKEALAESVVIIREGIKKNFESEGKYFGEPWKELAEKTLINKAAKGHGDTQILEDSGRLKEDITDDYGMIVTPFGTEVFVGSDSPSVHFHQGGTVKMPARPIIGVSEFDTAKIFTIFELAARAALAEAGF